MESEILLINPPPSSINIHNLGMEDCTPPLGLFRLGAALKKNGKLVNLFDFARHDNTKEELIEKLMDTKPKVVGISAMVANYNIISVAEIIRELLPETIIVLGGGFATSYSPAILQESGELFDFIIRGDGEIPFLNLLDSINTESDLILVKQSLKKSPGISFKLGDLLILNRVFLNSEPIKVKPYSDIPEWLQNYKKIVLLASRGCPWGCKFCSSRRLYGKNLDIYPVNFLISELKTLFLQYNIRSFSFLDDVFGFDKQWMNEFYNQLKNQNFDGIDLWFGTRGDLLDIEIIKKWADIGLNATSFGLESVHKSTQIATGKNLNLKKYEENVLVCKELNINIETGIMIGLPGETKKMVKETIDYVAELDPTLVHVSTLQLIPGTEYYEKMEKYGFKLTESNFDADELFDPKSYVVGGKFFKSETLSPDDIIELKEYAADTLEMRNAEFRFNLLNKFGAVKILSKWEEYHSS